MTDAAGLGDGDFVVIQESRCFLTGMFTVALWPHMTSVLLDGPGLPKGLAQAYALDLAAEVGTCAWDLTLTLPERLVADSSEARTPVDELAR
jgi:hypothetical protein